MVGRVEGRGGVELAAQQARRQGHPGDDPHVTLEGLPEEQVEGSLAEDVEDDLDAGHPGILDRLEGLLDLLDADPVVGDHARGDHLVHRFEEVGPVVDPGRQAVQLDQVELIELEVRPAIVDPAPERGGRVVGHVERHALADLRGDVQPLAGAFLEEAADHPLAAAIAVDVRRVEERDPGIGRRVERRQACRVVGRSVVAADRPGPEADRADLVAGLAESPELH